MGMKRRESWLGVGFSKYRYRVLSPWDVVKQVFKIRIGQSNRQKIWDIPDFSIWQLL
jgi:hypothetical protein